MGGVEFGVINRLHRAIDRRLEWQRDDVDAELFEPGRGLVT